MSIVINSGDIPITPDVRQLAGLVIKNYLFPIIGRAGEDVLMIIKDGKYKYIILCIE